MKGQFPSFLISLFLLNLSPSLVLAHNIKTSGDVGVTFHIEPDHSPVAGDSSQAWFALTRQGGELIPLSECDCELTVYLESAANSSTEPVLSPSLVPISPEQYQNIPGADIIFPQSGIYQLELTGKPKTEGDFTPFQVSYPVTVKPGVHKNPPPEQSTSNTPIEKETELNTTLEAESKSTNFYPWVLGIVAGVIGLIFKLNKK